MPLEKFTITCIQVILQIHDWKETQQFILGEGVDKELKRDDDGVNPRDSLPRPNADNSNDVISHCS
jgi:hypothetical protein